MENLFDILKSVESGKISALEAKEKIEHEKESYVDLGEACLDLSREKRTKRAEVVFCQGKDNHNLLLIYEKLYEKYGEVLGTRASLEQFEFLKKSLDFVKYDEKSRILKIEKEDKILRGNVVVACAGTSDLPVALEACETLEFFCSNAIKLFDVGVAGIHRLLDRFEILQKANAIVAVAGMEGALASVIAGLANCPVIAVPTSVGYGASFHGVAALLSMLNSCANSVSVVNIDNGFSAGYIASLINDKATNN